MTRTSDRVRALDALRGIAALGVVVFHYGGHFYATPYGSVLSGIYKNGYLFVDLFFVLSGFVLARSYRDGLGNGSITPSDFVLRRLARMYPLHLFTLLLVAVWQAHLQDISGSNFTYPASELFSFFANLLLLQNMGLSGASFNGPSWSISAEFYVNLLFCFVAMRRLRTPWFLATTLLTAVVIMSAWGFMGVFPQIFANVLTAGFLRCLMGFDLGVAVEAAGRRIPHNPATGIVFDAIALVALAMGWVTLARFGQSPAFAKGDFLLALCIFPAAILALAQGRVVPFVLGLGPLRYLGEISYSIYMIHFPMQLLLIIIDRSGWTLNFGMLSTFWAYLGLVIGASVVSYHLVERPARDAVVRHLGPLIRGDTR